MMSLTATARQSSRAEIFQSLDIKEPVVVTVPPVKNNKGVDDIGYDYQYCHCRNTHAMHMYVHVKRNLMISTNYT